MTKVIYISGPYSAETKALRDMNVRVAYLMAQTLYTWGYAPICPHMNSYGMESDDPWEDEFARFLVADLEFISRSDAVVMLPGWRDSRGACAEFAFAKWMGVPIFYQDYDLYDRLAEL